MALQLYHRWHCPERVRDFIDQQKLSDQIEFIEIGEVKDAEAKLDELTGGSQVPCLVIDGKPMLESREIVQWLQANLVESGGVARPWAATVTDAFGRKMSLNQVAPFTATLITARKRL